MRPACLPDDATLANYRDWSGRRQAVGMLAYLCGTGSSLGREWGGKLCGVSYYCESEADIVRLLAHGSDMILKAPWSGSGKGLRLGRGGYVPPLSGWCRRLLREQGGVVVEPIYNKVYDFALEFYANGHRGVTYTGLSVFLTTVRGTYAGNWVAAEEVKERWLSAWVPREMWRQLKDEVGAYLHRMFSGGYRGYVGVDMMLCRVPGRAGLCVHPCVEINLRRTMGQVSVDLARLLAPSAEARFTIGYARETGTAWDECQRQRKECPLVLENEKLRGGYLPLTPVGLHTHYHAALWVDSPEKVRPGMVERGFVQDAEGACPGV